MTRWRVVFGPRRAGASALEESGRKTDSWLRGAKVARGYSTDVSFDRVWKDTCAKADRFTRAWTELKIAHRVLAYAYDALGGGVEPKTHSRAYVATQLRRMNTSIEELADEDRSSTPGPG